MRAGVFLRLLVLGAAGGLAACAPLPAHVRRDPGDPWERTNRTVFAVNRALDHAVLRPLARAYEKAPAPPRRTLRRFFANLGTPASALNDLLQAHPATAARSLLRFAVNSTVGLAGTLDPASHLRLPEHRNDFGHTLAHWGVREGPYLMLPLLGPAFAREASALPVDVWTDPVASYAHRVPVPGYAVGGVRAVGLRAELLGADSSVDEAMDPYILVRDAYRQKRRYEIDPKASPPEEGLDEDAIERLLSEQKKTTNSG